MKRYDVKEELTKPTVIETEENDTVEETCNDEEEIPKKDTEKAKHAYSKRLKPVKLDITFVVIGIIITVVIPFAAVFFFDLTKVGIILLIVCVGLLDVLCLLAHRMMNKRIEV